MFRDENIDLSKVTQGHHGSGRTGTRTFNPGATSREQYDIKFLKPVARVTGKLYNFQGFFFSSVKWRITIGNNYLLLIP